RDFFEARHDTPSGEEGLWPPRETCGILSIMAALRRLLSPRRRHRTLVREGKELILCAMSRCPRACVSLALPAATSPRRSASTTACGERRPTSGPPASTVR